MAAKILIVDDEESIRFFAADGLSRAGWPVYEAESGEAALALMKQTPCDIVFLDLRLAGIDGLETLHQLKTGWPDIIVVIMTAYATLDSAIEAVRRGAFDYLRKPCPVQDLVACARRAQARHDDLMQQRPAAQPSLRSRAEPASRPAVLSPDTVQTGNLFIDLGARKVMQASQPVLLTPTEYELLGILAKALGQPISLEQLIKDGLGYNPRDTQARETLRVHISRLRGKLGADYILTIRGGGYTLANIPPPRR